MVKKVVRTKQTHVKSGTKDVLHEVLIRPKYSRMAASSVLRGYYLGRLILSNEPTFNPKLAEPFFEQVIASFVHNDIALFKIKKTPKEYGHVVLSTTDFGCREVK